MVDHFHCWLERGGNIGENGLVKKNGKRKWIQVSHLGFSLLLGRYHVVLAGWLDSGVLSKSWSTLMIPLLFSG